MKGTTGESLFDILGLEKRADAPEAKPLEKPDVDAGEAAKAILVRLAVPAVIGAIGAMGAMADTGLTVVMSSHNLGEIEGFCDRVGLLFNGSLVFNREIDTLKGSVHKVQAAFAREVTRDDFKDIEIMNIKKQGSVYNIIVKGDEAKIKQRAEELGAMLCDIVPLSLEEVFIYELEVLGYDFDGIDR